MSYEHVAYVTSQTDSRKSYEIKRNDRGVLSCGCTAYRFAKGVKTCKHLQAFSNAIHENVRPYNGKPEGPKAMSTFVGMEQFTIVRAMKLREG